MKNIFLLLVLTLFLNVFCYSQNSKQLSEREEDSLYIDYCFEYVHSNFTYDDNLINYPIKDEDWYDSRNIQQVIKRKKGICESFSLVFAYYVNLNASKNIKQYYTIANILNEDGSIGKGHQANLIKFYDTYYFFDPTWDIKWKRYLPSRYNLPCAAFSLYDKNKHGFYINNYSIVNLEPEFK